MKKITRWIELIFIFGIPLLFMVLCLQFKTINTYDENNNVIESEKVLDIKNLDFIATEEKTYKSYNYYTTEELDELETYLNNYVNMDIENGFNLEEYNYTFYTDYTKLIEVGEAYPKPTSDGNLYSIGDEISFYIEMQINNNGNYWEMQFEYNINVMVLPWDYEIQYILYDIEGENYEIIRDNNDNTISLNNPITIENILHTIQFYLEEDLEMNLYNFKINEFSIGNNLAKSIEYKTIEENAITKVLNILYDSLGIENNLIVQLIIIYTLLWIIMFIIWHIFYLPFNKLLHMFEKD